MFKLDPESRLSLWYNLRNKLETSNDPYGLVSSFWSQAPMVPHNHRLDPYNQKSWPTPWDIIYTNVYDDFTLAVMIAYTIKLTERFKDVRVEVRMMTDKEKTKLYNLVVVDDKEILNYHRSGVIKSSDLTLDLYLDNLIEIIYPR